MTWNFNKFLKWGLKIKNIKNIRQNSFKENDPLHISEEKKHLKCCF